MNLAVSQKVVQEVANFSKLCGIGALISWIKLIIPLPIISVVFFRSEIYSELITCYFDFGDDIGFFSEDVLSAVADARSKTPVYSKPNLTDEEIVKSNDAYVRDVLGFFQRIAPHSLTCRRSGSKKLRKFRTWP